MGSSNLVRIEGVIHGTKSSLPSSESSSSKPHSSSVINASSLMKEYYFNEKVYCFSIYKLTQFNEKLIF
jgi:NADP-dependent 3-hydroxy acid dehydrogenase YdfG